MKRIALLFIVAMTTIFASAQTGNMSNPNGLTLDSASNAAAEGPTVTAPLKSKAASFTIETTKISGTVAGKIYLQGANRAGQWSSKMVDSLTVYDGTLNYGFERQYTGYPFYRVLVSLTGGTVSYRATATFKQP